MKNQDLELAKLKLTEDDLSLVVVKDSNVVYETKKQGVTGFLQVIKEMQQDLVNASVADKIVGVAAAMLCVYSGVTSVFALTISEGGIKLLKENSIECLFENKVSHILNRDKTDVCPFEKTALASKTPEEAYVNLKSLAGQMMKRSKTGC